MRSHPDAVAREAPSRPGPSANAAGRVRRRAAWVAVALAALAAAGCGGSRLRPIASEGEFAEYVLKPDRPVLVEFYKGGCVSCLFIDPCMDRLAGEYADRVIFTKFELENFWSKITCPPIWKRYRVALFPTVILFVNGQERKRWVVDYSGDSYRQVLNEVTRAPAATKTPDGSGGPPGKP
jgi:thiol-disulfide isomerase/thioredoxin